MNVKYLSLTLTMIPLLLTANIHYVDINSHNPTPPYTNWLTAATVIQDAVDLATAGDVVLVSNGIYKTGTTVTPGFSSLNRIVITNDLTVQSVNGPNVTIIEGSPPQNGGNWQKGVRGVYMSSGSLSGFTITKGHASHGSSGGGVNMYDGNGIVSNCILEGNEAWDYGGGSYGGTLNNCELTANSAFLFGGGSYYGTLNNCILTDNIAYAGGGSFEGTLNNCILTDNIAYAGGGSSRGILYNCILIGNSAGYGGGSESGSLVNCNLKDNWAVYGGGTYHSDSKNCIIYYNYARNGKNYMNSLLNYCCTTPLPPGNGNITNIPILINSSHIHSLSPCIGAGSSDYVTGSDIDGENWSSPPSIGCDESQFPLDSSLDVTIELNYSNIVVGEELIITANINGTVASNHWVIGNYSLFNNITHISKSWETNGIYDVVLTVYNADNPGGVSATATITILSNSNFYVDINNRNPIYPFNSWETAATNIQDAVDVASLIQGSVVWVSNGVYKTGTRSVLALKSLNRLVITKDIIVRSVNGPEVTFIEGSFFEENGYLPVRGVFMTSGILSGFTVTNGHTDRINGCYIDFAGGGVNMFSGNGVISNCMIVGNSASLGGGSCFGTLNNCILTDNAASLAGGSSYDILRNCTITKNNSLSPDVGGVRYGMLENCILYHNYAANSYVTNSHVNYLLDEMELLKYCCTIPSNGVGCVTNNPEFIDAENGDFQLKLTSLCIDAGKNQKWMKGSTDFIGNNRIMNGTVDIGAYEFGYKADLKVLLEGGVK